jgi:hypothetical protein
MGAARHKMIVNDDLRHILWTKPRKHPAPTPAHAECKSWCASSSKTWSDKCSFQGCAACTECGTQHADTEGTTTTTTTTDTEGAATAAATATECCASNCGCCHPCMQFLDDAEPAYSRQAFTALLGREDRFFVRKCSMKVRAPHAYTVCIHSAYMEVRAAPVERYIVPTHYAHT